MNSLGLLKVLITTNLLLAAAYFSFAAFEWGLEYFRFGVSPGVRVHFGRRFFLGALVLPSLIAFIPFGVVTRFSLPDFRPAAEGEETLSSNERGAIARKSISLTNTHRLRKDYRLNTDLAASFGARIALFIFFVGLFFSVRLFLRNFIQLRKILRGGYLLHRSRRTKVLVSSDIDIPFSAWMGWSNWVVLPASLLNHCGDFRLALRHEIQHHRSGDTRWIFLLDTLGSFSFRIQRSLFGDEK